MKSILITGLLLCLAGLTLSGARLVPAQYETDSSQDPDKRDDKASSISTDSPIEIKTDRFSNVTTITLKPQALLDKPEHLITIGINTKIEQKRSDDVFNDSINAYVYLESHSKEPVDFGDRQIRFLVNGRPLSEPPGKIELKALVNPKPDFPIYKSGVKIFDRSDLDLLSKANQVEMRVGPLELTLSAATVTTLREYATKVLTQHKAVNGRK